MDSGTLRVCVGCRQAQDRDLMIRLTVDCTDGRVVLNNAPKRLFGRSAYLCKSRKCLDRAMKGARLRNALAGRKKRKEARKQQKDSGGIRTQSRQISWPLESQLINAIADLCPEQAKTCHNTHERRGTDK